MERSGAEQAEFAGLVFERFMDRILKALEKGLLSESGCRAAGPYTGRNCGGSWGCTVCNPQTNR